MALINVIPAISSYAVAVPGAPGKAAQVRVHDGNGDRLLATVTPFPGYEGSVSVAMGDVDGDGVYDLIVGAGKDHAPEVVVYSGKATERKKWRFATELARFQAFAAEARGGVSVAAAQIDGTSADNIIVGSGPGIASEVRVYGSKLPSSPGTAPALFSTFSPYADDRSGVSLATGFVDFSTGRHSIVTAPGPGSPAEVKVFAFSLLKPINKRRPRRRPHRRACGRAEPAGQHRLVQAVRRRLSRRRFAGDGLAGRIARRRQADRRQPACGRRHGESVLQRLGLGRGARALSAQPERARPRAHLPRNRELQSVRRDIRHARRHHEHDHRRRPAGQRRGRAGPERERREVRARQADTLRRRRCRPGVSEKSFPQQARSRPCSAAIRDQRQPDRRISFAKCASGSCAGPNPKDVPWPPGGLEPMIYLLAVIIPPLAQVRGTGFKRRCPVTRSPHRRGRRNGEVEHPRGLGVALSVWMDEQPLRPASGGLPTRADSADSMSATV